MEKRSYYPPLANSIHMKKEWT